MKADKTQAERRARHKYTIRRPRALQYSFRQQFITAGEEPGPSEHGGEHAHAEKSDISSHLPEAVARQRERQDLFVDLIWVGIIGNLSEVFSSLNFSEGDSQPGRAILVFTLVFLPSWRIWNAMREFLNNYYMDDLAQRMFTFWILALSVFYGNQLAYLAEDIETVKTWCISTYLLILGSFMMIEEIYSIWIPWLRKLVLIQTLIRIPGVALWVTGIYLKDAKAVGPILAAIIWEYLCPVFLDSPLAEHLTPGQYKKALDVNHFSSRMASFFIIVLGEGVLQLVKDGPLGRGLNGSTGTMIWVLLIYFNFSFLYFFRDGSRTFVPAVRHKGWRFLVFVFWHIPLFASLLTFVAAVMFILRHQNEQNYSQQKDESTLTPEEVTNYIYNAVWTCATSISIIVLSTLILAILDRPLDKPGTLRVDNRYIRMGGRVAYQIFVMCLPIKKDINPALFLGLAGGGLVMLTMYEWSASLERGGSFIEPKGITLMMSHELKGKRQVAVAHGEAEDHHFLRRKFEVKSLNGRAGEAGG
jgi:low temperature requirement protein LtrA